MKNSKEIISSIVFISIGIILFIIIQNILVPNGLDNQGNTERRINGIKYVDENNLDILFLGSSLVYNGVSPMKLYEDSKIVSYSLASSAQPIEVSYYLLKNVYKYQCPKIVMLEANTMIEDTTSPESSKNSYWRYILDALPLGKTKLEIMKEYETYDFSDGNLSVIFPIIKYHSRWNELTANDFKSIKKEFMYSAGETVVSMVNPINITRNEIDYWAEEYKNLNNSKINGKEFELDFSNPSSIQIEEINISKKALLFLERMIMLCEEHGTQLILFKIPDATYLQNRPETWTLEKSKLLKETADRLDIPFLDMAYDVDLGIDFTQDTPDEGKHLNVRGAHKLTTYLAKYIENNYNIKGKEYILYNEALEIYNRISTYAYLNSDTNFQSYIKRLINSKNEITICISACSDYTRSMNNEDYDLLKQLNLDYIDSGKYMDSYVAIISKGELIYEAVSSNKIDKEIEINGKSIHITSAGWIAGYSSSIDIEDVTYGMGYEGLNFVVIDNDTGMIIDTVNFDTYLNEKPCSRITSNIGYLFETYIENYAYG